MVGNKHDDEGAAAAITSIRVARSYDGYAWERAASALSSEWDCVLVPTSSSSSYCTALLPAGQYVLQTYNATTATASASDAHSSAVARFLEQATFGTTRRLLAENSNNGDGDSSSSIAFATAFLQAQIHNVPPTYLRPYFRQRANPIWRFHKPEFASNFQEPCAADATWHRSPFTVRDRDQTVSLERVTISGDDDNDYWQIAVNGHVRAVLAESALVGSPRQAAWLQPGEYRYCATDDHTRRGVFGLEMEGKCRKLKDEVLVVDFPDGYDWAASEASSSAIVLSENLPALADASYWQPLPFKDNDSTADYRLTTSVAASCANIPTTANGDDGPPVLARTVAGEWLIFTPRIRMETNTLEAPLPDGGAASWAEGRTQYCSAVPRTLFNENDCVLSSSSSTGQVCLAGGFNTTVGIVDTSGGAAVVVCGSPGEVGSDFSAGDHWLDVASLNRRQAEEQGLPEDTTSFPFFARQREFVWSDVVLRADDQLRQRVAWALVQIFSLSKRDIASEARQTESFLNYYDIFVRNAFGNYLDILREVSYSPLMAESLSFLNSKSLEVVYNREGVEIYPDENFARELCQLFTVGQVPLNLDGTIAGADETYGNDDIMSFARVWTGFAVQQHRANMETPRLNSIDPLRIEVKWRDRFPKTDLYGGYLGDGYPLCVDLPERTFLRVGAKYRLLGSSPVPELIRDDPSWVEAEVVNRLQVQPGSGLYDRLCASGGGGSCTFPSVVVLESNLSHCDNNTSTSAAAMEECNVETIRVVQIENLFYEYIRVPCVQLAFYNDGRRAKYFKGQGGVCANPRLSVASEACCESDESDTAHPACLFSGERMTIDAAKRRCESRGETLCGFRFFETTDECRHEGFHWIDEGCRVRVKVKSDDGQIAIVHDTPPGNPPKHLRVDSPSYFRAYWLSGEYPSFSNNCGDGSCEQIDDACICDVTVTEQPIFVSPPPSAALILGLLRVGHADPALYDDTVTVYTMQEGIDYRYHSLDGSCCGIDTVFEVIDRNGNVQFLRNVGSSVTIDGSEFSFRNPPHFNSLNPLESSVSDAEYETEALLQHLFYHANTAPFVASRFIQRLGGVSNPSPRYVRAVALAFREGIYTATTTESFGKNKYGDMAALVAAVLFDREARSPTLMADPAHGSLLEPILKVTGFMRAMEFESTTPLVELDSMNTKIGQMAFEQNSVFSFFDPHYSPPGPTSSAMLSAPESQVMSAGRVIGLLNGLLSLIQYGLVKCGGGFGAYGACRSSPQRPTQEPSGYLTYQSESMDDAVALVQDLSILLTSGRLSHERMNTIQQAFESESDPEAGQRLALQLIVTSPEFHTTSAIDPNVAVSSSSTDSNQEDTTSGAAPAQEYKAVIHLALLGGCDSFNVLVPHSSCTQLHQEYHEIRDTVALNDAEVLPIDGDTASQPCLRFGLHHELPFLKSLYDESDLLFLANTGVLTEPVDRTDYLEKTLARLFAHDSMQEEVKALDPLNAAVGTGALGRMADVLQVNGFRTDRIVIEDDPTSLAGYSLSPIVTLDEDGVVELNVDSSQQPVLEEFLQGGLSSGGENGDLSYSGTLGDLWSSILGQSLHQTEELLGFLGATSNSSEFQQDSSMGKQFRLCSELMASHEARGVDRDVFFVSMPGFDSHSDVSETLQDQFQELNAALEEFVSRARTAGVWENVVLVQTSEFGRTLSPNSGYGTDHAWGGNYWITGGSVRGNRILGAYPSTLSQEDSELEAGQRGRLIPTTSWDSVFNAVADWMSGGTTSATISSEQLDYVLPNRGQFPNLFSSQDLFQT